MDHLQRQLEEKVCQAPKRVKRETGNGKREARSGKREEGSAGSATLDYTGVEEGGVEGGVGRRML